MVLNNKHKGYLFGENSIGFSLPGTSEVTESCFGIVVKNAYKTARNNAIRKNSKTGVTAPSGLPGQSLLRKFKQPVNTEFFTGNSQSCNFAARLKEALELRQETVPPHHTLYI
jgi:hypothetical protein